MIGYFKVIWSMRKEEPGVVATVAFQMFIALTAVMSAIHMFAHLVNWILSLI